LKDKNFSTENTKTKDKNELRINNFLEKNNPYTKMAIANERYVVLVNPVKVRNKNMIIYAKYELLDCVELINNINVIHINIE
jgi:hypothetical protein